MQCLYLQPECSNVGSRIPAIVVAQDTITNLNPTSSLLTRCANVSPVRNSEIQSPSAWEQPTIPGQLIHQEQIRTKGSRRARLSVHVRLLRRHQSKWLPVKRQISLRSDVNKTSALQKNATMHLAFGKAKGPTERTVCPQTTISHVSMRTGPESIESHKTLKMLSPSCLLSPSLLEPATFEDSTKILSWTKV